MPTGPHTPWPNWAETIVRIFKATLADIVTQLDSNPDLKDVTPRNLMRKAAYVRNSIATFGGKTPLELAFGRRPRDLFVLENSNPEQLTTPGTDTEAKDQELQKLAMKSYLEARQQEDLRKGIASKLLPS